MTLDAYTRARYRQQQQHNARYLGLGDPVDARGTFLGSLHVTIDWPASRSSRQAARIERNETHIGMGPTGNLEHRRRSVG